MFESLAGRKPRHLDYDKYKRYAVMAPYMPDTNAFLFQVRSDKLNRQPGEICFPGGRIEKGETPLEAGIRETMEELLVKRDSIRVIAPLDILTTPYYSVIYPHLMELTDYSGTFNPDEVAEVFSVPFEFFLKNEPKVYYNQITVQPEDHDFPYELLGTEPYPWGTARYSVLFYQYERWVIWGMTARFMHTIVKLYREEEGF